MHYNTLFECRACELARDVSHARLTTQDKVVYNAYFIPREHCTYLAYGAGGLLWEAECIRRILAYQFNAITVIVIDPRYSDIIEDEIDQICPNRRQHHKTIYDDTAILSACQAFQKYIINKRDQIACKTHLRFTWYASAQSYRHHVRRNIHQAADICTWIDPDVAVTPADPYAISDTSHVPACLKHKSQDYILTIDEERKPTLISHAYEGVVTQCSLYNLHDATVSTQLSLCETPVYLYEPQPHHIIIQDTIHNIETVSQQRRAHRLLYQLLQKTSLLHICIPRDIQKELRRRAAHTS